MKAQHFPALFLGEIFSDEEFFFKFATIPELSKWAISTLPGLSDGATDHQGKYSQDIEHSPVFLVGLPHLVPLFQTMNFNNRWHQSLMLSQKIRRWLSK